MVTSRCPGWVGTPTQPGQWPVTTYVYKPEAANTVWSSRRAVYRSKHVEPSINFGIINSITSLHLVGYSYWFTLQCTDPWILNKSVFKCAGITVSHFFSMLPSTLKYLYSVEPVTMHFPAKQQCTNDTVCNVAMRHCTQYHLYTGKGILASSTE